MDKTELQELQQAVEMSPENTYLRFLLIKKMRLFPGMASELEYHCAELLRQEPQHIEAKKVLAEAYFKQKKYSACIVICEELYESGLCGIPEKIILSKSYMKEGSMQQAQEIYRDVIQENPDFTDDDLDAAFRVRTTSVEEDSGGFMEKPAVDFSHVGGMDHVKKEIDLKIIQPLKHADLYASYGKKIGGGILLYGPPGCGKTFISKATAGEIQANFINVGLNDILDMWIGGSEKNLHAYFEHARNNTPCVLFFDEIDALGAKRTDMRQSAGKSVINQFLAELDGVEHSNEGILIIGATNSPWHLDSAFRRPGRFDRIIFVPPPDQQSRQKILQIKLQDKPTDSIDYASVAKKTNKYSGADMNAIIDIAVERKLEEAIKTGVPAPLRTKDLLNAAKKHKASTVDWFTTAKNYAMFANQSGLYDDILEYLK